MMMMLPDAVERERENMLHDSMNVLKNRGFSHFDVRELPGFEEPRSLQIPVLNIPMKPDIYATSLRGDTALIVVEPSTDLGEEACGRRWQALMAWASAHHAQVHVFVHPEDQHRAADIAQFWHLDPELVEALPRVH